MKTLAFRIVPADERKPPRPYTVAGARPGVSFFPRVDYEATRPKVRGVMDFAHYHTYGEVVEFLER